MSALSRLLSRIALYASALGLVGMTAIIGWQVFARYVLSASPSWTEQAALYLMLWFILFAAAAGVREGFHIRLTLAEMALTGRSRTLLRVICHLIVLVFGLFMTWNGAELVAATWQHVIPTIGLPRGSAYLPVVGAGALVAFFSIEQIVAEINGKAVEPLWN